MQIFIGLAIGYTTICSILFIFPNLLHKKKIYKNKKLDQVLKTKSILKLGHRGSPRYFTQNTIQGFQFSKSYVDSIQMDVCQTKDNILVVHHDVSLLRTCNNQKDINQYNYNQLPQFQSKIKLDFGVLKYIQSKNQKIPKLQDVFKKFDKQLLLNIQLKTPTQTAIQSLVKLIHKYQRTQTTIIGIRNYKNFQLQKTNPQLKYFMNDKKVLNVLLSYFLGGIGLLKINQNSMQIPVHSAQLQQWHIGRSSNKLNAKIFMKAIKFLNIISIPLVWHLKRRGIFTFGWVCNSKQGYQNCLKMGAQGIMTDDVKLLKKFIQQK